ncbi:hypothetical protein CEK26_012018 [Fusarium fujikuroi]|nr:hypothetical protein CEK27_012035 [Fusarium fujikuroi]QGI98949.1 hypothetical protein CEK26_012018 [Fusarium fujikuroi]
MDNPTDSDNKSPLSFSRTSSNTIASTNIETSQEPDMLSHPKAADIIKACEWRDIGRLRSLAEAHGGFLSDALRRQACSLLPSVISQSLLAPQDMARANAVPDQSDAELSLRKSELSSLITEVLRRYPYLCYFQGYHDISQVLLLVLAPTWRARVLARLSVLRIRDFMLPNFGPTTAQLRLLPDIIHAADPKLRRHLAGVEPFYALAGTLTMYAHNIETYQDIARLFDVFLAREPVFTVYVFAQIILDRRNEIFEIDEPDMLHVILGKVPTKMDLDELIIKSAALFGQHPPETLSYWRHISNFSALKTARDIETCAKQTMEEGSELFEKQVKELHWQEMWDHIKLVLWRYRRPAKTVGMALVVGALAFYLRRNPILVHRIASFFSP